MVNRDYGGSKKQRNPPFEFTVAEKYYRVIEVKSSRHGRHFSLYEGASKKRLLEFGEAGDVVDFLREKYADFDEKMLDLDLTEYIGRLSN